MPWKEPVMPSNRAEKELMTMLRVMQVLTQNTVWQLSVKLNLKSAEDQIQLPDQVLNHTDRTKSK